LQKHRRIAKEPGTNYGNAILELLRSEERTTER